MAAADGQVLALSRRPAPPALGSLPAPPSRGQINFRPVRGLGTTLLTPGGASPRPGSPRQFCSGWVLTLQPSQPHLTVPLRALGSSADHPSHAAPTTASNSAASAGPSAPLLRAALRWPRARYPGDTDPDAGLGVPALPALSGTATTSMMLPRSPDPASKDLTSMCRGLPRARPHTGPRMRGDQSSAGSVPPEATPL